MNDNNFRSARDDNQTQKTKKIKRTKTDKNIINTIGSKSKQISTEVSMLSNQPKTSGKTTKIGMTSQGISSQDMTDRPSMKAVNSIGTSGYASKTAGKGSIQTTLKVARQIIKKSQYMQQPPAPKPSMKLSTNIHKSLMFQMKKPNAAESISTRNLQRRNTAIEMQVIPAAKG